MVFKLWLSTFLKLNTLRGGCASWVLGSDQAARYNGRLSLCEFLYCLLHLGSWCISDLKLFERGLVINVCSCVGPDSERTPRNHHAASCALFLADCPYSSELQ